MIVTGLEHPVVERLAVVRIGAGLQEQAGEGERVRVPGLADRAQFPLAERPGQHRERGGQAVPEVAGVRISAGVQQEPCGSQDGILTDLRVVPGVGQVEQRLPPERAALAAGLARIGGQDAP